MDTPSNSLQIPLSLEFSLENSPCIASEMHHRAARSNGSHCWRVNTGVQVDGYFLKDASGLD